MTYLLFISQLTFINQLTFKTQLSDYINHIYMVYHHLFVAYHRAPCLFGAQLNSSFNFSLPRHLQTDSLSALTNIRNLPGGGGSIYWHRRSTLTLTRWRYRLPPLPSRDVRDVISSPERDFFLALWPFAQKAQLRIPFFWLTSAAFGRLWGSIVSPGRSYYYLRVFEAVSEIGAVQADNDANAPLR